MKFYRENNINPAASCLPLVAQIPVFFSLYFVLRNFANHVPEGADLSWLHIVPRIAAPANSHWSGYLLLAIYASSQVLSTWFMSTTMDKMQRGIMLVLPARLHHGRGALPGRPRHLLGDDEPVDGRAGARDAAARPEDARPVARRAEALVADGAARGAEGGGDPLARSAQPQTPPPQPRRVKRKKGGARR